MNNIRPCRLDSAPPSGEVALADGQFTQEEKEILSVIYYLNEIPADKLPLEWTAKIKENFE